MTSYERRIRERFPALVADPIWSAIEKLVQEDWRDEDESWFDGVQQHCIDLCKRLGLPFGPAKCGGEHEWPERGDVPDGDECPRCIEEKEARARDDEEWRLRYPDVRISSAGLIKRVVQ
jgi:hypothetical protein